MTLGEFLKPLNPKSIVEWEEYDHDGYDDVDGTLDDELSGEMSLEQFLADDSYGYRTRDLELKDVTSIDITPYENGLCTIKIMRNLF